MRNSTISIVACGLARSACSLYHQDVVWTLTRGHCGSGGCHEPGRDGFSYFRVWPDNGDPCAVIASFNDFCGHSDFVDSPESTRLYQRAMDEHGGVAAPDPEALRAWIQAALDLVGR
jgi:hypothetical protein